MSGHRRKIETYPHLVNVAAFVDKIDINVWGIRRKIAPARTVEEQNLAIGGPGRFYGRCSRCRSTTSGNRLQMAYGLTRPFPNLSPYKVTMWAGKRPAMCADSLLVLDSLMRHGYRAKVSAVELAFDIEGVLLDQLTEELCTRAQTKEVKGTLYVGGVNSLWQVKFYVRTSEIGRIEFTLRSTFLRRLGIVKIQELYLLRRAHLWDLISFREIDQSRGDELPPRIRIPWEELGHGVPPLCPPSMIIKFLRKSRVDPGHWVVPSPRERLLQKMQRNLLF